MSLASERNMMMNNARYAGEYDPLPRRCPHGVILGSPDHCQGCENEIEAEFANEATQVIVTRSGLQHLLPGVDPAHH